MDKPARSVSIIIGSLLFILIVIIVLAVKTQPARTAPVAEVVSTAPVSPAVNAGVLGTMTKNAGCVTTGGLPDHECTPGAADARVRDDNVQSTICVSGYSASVRPPESVTNKIKVTEMQMYGDTDSMGNYELDHLVSLEIGGCPDCVANLWPEPYNGALGARQKDTVENYLHKQVCDGNMSLREAQSEIATDWVAVYNALPK